MSTDKSLWISLISKCTQLLPQTLWMCLASVIQFFVSVCMDDTMEIRTFYSNYAGWKSTRISCKCKVFAQIATHLYSAHKHNIQHSYLDRWSVVLTAKFSLITVSNSLSLSVSHSHCTDVTSFGNLCRFWLWKKTAAGN